jgi:hypothetical protein
MSKASYSKQDRALIVALRKEGKSWPKVAAEAGEKLGRSITAEGARFQFKQANSNAPTRPAPKKPRKGHSLDEFRSQFDITKKIDDKVAELLPDDREEYFTDDEFRQLCGVSVQNWRRHAELDRYRAYQFRKPNFHAWAPKPIVAAMQEITGHAGH